MIGHYWGGMFNCPASTHWLIDCALAQYTEFIGSTASIIFLTAKRDHKILLSQRSNSSNMSCNSNNLGS